MHTKLKTTAARRMSSLSLNLWEANATAVLDPDSPAVLEHLKLAYQSTQQRKYDAGALRVADAAMNLGKPAFAATCYEALATKPMLPGDKVVLLEKVVHAHTETRDIAALRRSAHALADLTPGHLHNTDRADYLDLLCGEPLEAIVPRLNTEAAAEANAHPHQRLLWAMIYSRRDQKEPLRRELAGLENATVWTPGERAVIAGLLAKAGESARAWRMVEKLPMGFLLNEEAAMAAAAK